MNSSLFDISSYISVHPISLNVAIAIFFAIALLLLSAFASAEILALLTPRGLKN